MMDYLRGLLIVISLFIAIVKTGQCITFLCASAKGNFATLRDSFDRNLFWIALDLLFYFLLWTIILAHAFQLSSQDDFSNYHVSQIPAFSTMFIGAIGYQKSAGAVFLLLIAAKAFKCLSYFPKLAFMNSTIVNMVSEVSTFVVLLCIILTCFSSSAVHFFGDSLNDIVSFPRAIVKMFQMSLGMTDYSGMRVNDTSFGLFAPIFYFTTMGLLSFLMLNMVLGFTVPAYSYKCMCCGIVVAGPSYSKYKTVFFISTAQLLRPSKLTWKALMIIVTV